MENDPRDSQTQPVDGNASGTGLAVSPGGTMENSQSDSPPVKDMRILYIQVNQGDSATPCISSNIPEPVIHTSKTPKTIRTMAVLPPKPDTPCEEWEGAHTPLGYGYFTRDGKTVYVHRDTWEKANGSIPPGFMVCHACDNRGCRRLDHLWLGTQADNMADCKAKGRPHGRPFKYTEDEMRAMAATPGPYTVVGKQFGLGKDTIQRWRKQFGIVQTIRQRT